MDGTGGAAGGPSAARRSSVEAALKLIRPGDRVYLGTGCAAPRTLLRALEAAPSGPPDLEFVSFVTTDALPRGPDGAPSTRYRHRVFFVGSDVRGLGALGRLDYVPMSLEELPSLLARGRLPIDVAIVQVSPPDAHGFVSLGVSVDLAPAVLAVARRAIAEVNPAMPRTCGESAVHVGRFDALVDVPPGVAEYVHPPTGDVARQVARYVAAIIEDGSTLQVGLGRVPNEVLRHLTDRRDLGIHSDVVTDGVVDLIEAGVVTGRRKTRRTGAVVASYALGTRRLYDAIDDNPRFAFLPIEQVCDPAVVAAHAKMVSITQAFAVDLTGQVCVDQMGGEFYGGVSTQAAFLEGAARSPGGKPIICLASTGPDGQTRIKPMLEAGDAAGIARSDVHYVVTEHGVAYLFGKSIRERAVALTEIAHPAHRDALLAEARRLGYVPAGQYLASQRAYPVEEERRATLKNGAEVLIRPARAADAAGLMSLFHAMPAEDRYTRFFRTLSTLSLAELQKLCNVDHEREVAFLAVTGPREGETVVGSGLYVVNATTNMADVAFMTAQGWQGCGLGAALQRRLQEYAQARGLKGFTADVLSNNSKMLRLAKAARGAVTTSFDGGEAHVTILFEGEPAA